MAEPQPATIHEGDQTSALPANAEDRATAAAMSALDTRGEDEAAKKEVDTEALGKAMNNLGTGDAPKKVEEKKKVVKVEPADVNLLVSCRPGGMKGGTRVMDGSISC